MKNKIISTLLGVVVLAFGAVLFRKRRNRLKNDSEASQ